MIYTGDEWEEGEDSVEEEKILKKRAQQHKEGPCRGVGGGGGGGVGGARNHMQTI